MDKVECVKRLNNDGITAVYEQGLVMVYNDSLTMEQLSKKLKEMDYNCSFGLLPTKAMKTTV